MPELIVQTGKHRGRKLVLPQSEIYIGRDDDCQIRLTSSDISRRHCRLLCGKDSIRVRDLGSRNGTWVNNVMISEEVTLGPGDTLRVGPITLQMPGRRSAPAIDRPAEQKPPRVTLPGRPADASDEDIASWLTDEAGDAEGGTGDTTIVTRAQLEAAASQELESTGSRETPAAPAAPEAARARPDKPAPATPGSGSGKPPATVADEAADIIRRHWQKLKRGQAEQQP